MLAALLLLIIRFWAWELTLSLSTTTRPPTPLSPTLSTVGVGVCPTLCPRSAGVLEVAPKVVLLLLVVGRVWLRGWLIGWLRGWLLESSLLGRGCRLGGGSCSCPIWLSNRLGVVANWLLIWGSLLRSSCVELRGVLRSLGGSNKSDSGLLNLGLGVGVRVLLFFEV